MMKFYMENECLGRRPDGGLDYLGHDEEKSAAVFRIETARLANKCPNDADLALVDDLMLVDANLMDDADKIEVVPWSKHRIR